MIIHQEHKRGKRFDEQVLAAILEPIQLRIAFSTAYIDITAYQLYIPSALSGIREVSFVANCGYGGIARTGQPLPGTR